MKPAVLALGSVLTGALLALAGDRPGTCRLEIELVDAGTGRSLPGLIRIADGAGRHLPPKDCFHGARASTPRLPSAAGWS